MVTKSNKKYIDHSKSVRALKFSPNSQSLLTSGEDSYIHLIDIETMKRKMSVTGHADWVTCLSVNSFAKSFVSGSLDNSIKVWDINSGKCLKTID
jgi:WD repeat-containing protein 61